MDSFGLERRKNGVGRGEGEWQGREDGTGPSDDVAHILTKGKVVFQPESIGMG